MTDYDEALILLPVSEWADQNEDWLATSSIYDATEVQPLRGSEIQQHKGFFGCVTITISTASTAYFHPIENDEGHYRYFTLSKLPQVLLNFKYIASVASAEQGCEDDVAWPFRATPPTSVTIKWVHYPPEWPDSDNRPLLALLWEESNRLLQEEQLSFGVCEFCEHDAVSRYTSSAPWTLFHRDDSFRLYRFPPRLDSMYHNNYGTKMQALNEARRLPAGASTTRKHKKLKGKRPPSSLPDPSTAIPLPRPTTAEDYARQTLIQEWQQLYTTDCPICFETLLYSEGIILPCHHFVCEICFGFLLQFKIKELSMYRTNPFACPVENCRHALPIVGFVKQHLPASEMDKIRKWIKDMKYPPCFSLDRCLSKVCGAMESMRRTTKDSINVYCDQCQKHWCELCLKRFQDGEEESTHKDERCDDITAWNFCKRYLAASDVQKQTCETKYPWIVSYAHARQHDGEALTWILQNGQVCPNCANGVERIAGCFHVQCPTCATHFCYECGDKLFPPYYGTHHCWERLQLAL